MPDNEFPQLSLEALGNHDLGDEFKLAIEKVYETFQNPGGLEAKGERMKASVVVKLDFDYNLETGACAMVSGVETKIPKRQKRAQQVFVSRKGEGMKIEKAREIPLPLSIAAANGEESVNPETGEVK